MQFIITVNAAYGIDGISNERGQRGATHTEIVTGAWQVVEYYTALVASAIGPRTMRVVGQTVCPTGFVTDAFTLRYATVSGILTPCNIGAYLHDVRHVRMLVGGDTDA